MKPEEFQRAVLDWYQHQGRTDLPWQNPITPYRVWISEIMLQQTQVTTVIPYFERFMTSFPTIESLAEASIDEVLHHWTGLGYYARARNLHKTAQIVAFEMNQQFPDTVDALSALPGIGRSTAGAIRSIGFRKPAAILDGNVKRVLARFAAIDGWPGKTAVHNQLWDVAEHYSPDQRTQEYTQAMMDLGALLCTKTSPQCGSCPIASGCEALTQGNQSLFPGKKPKKANDLIGYESAQRKRFIRPEQESDNQETSSVWLWHKTYIKRIRQRFGLSKYQMLWITFGKGIVIGYALAFFLHR